MAADVHIPAIRSTRHSGVTWPAACAALVAGCVTAPVMAAAQCSIDPIHDLLGVKGAQVTMRVSDDEQACGTQLWVQEGVIPFTRVEQVMAPVHGNLVLNDPTRFVYHPEQGYRGRTASTSSPLGTTLAGPQ